MKKAALIYDKAMHEARKYWCDKLESVSFDGRIAPDHPRPNDGQPQISSFEQELDEEVNALLQRLTAGNHFLLYTTLVLALRICLYKYTGERGVTVFSPAISESAVENLLPIGGSLDGEATFKDALLATKELLSNAFKYQQYPFSRMLLDIAEEERRPERLPVIASMAGFNERIPDIECDIAVLFETAENRAAAAFRFDSRLYEEATVRNFFRFFNSILRQGLGEMSIRIADLKPDYIGVSVSSDKVIENGEFVAAAMSNGIKSAEKSEAPRLHRLIKAQAAKHPENVAVAEGGHAVTYETLNRHAERLAETLLADAALDVRKPVLILMDASTEMIVSMFAALKIGAAFTIIKPLSIIKPINEIFEALDCECIIYHRRHAAEFQQIQDSLSSIRHRIAVEYLPSSSTGGDGSASFEIERNSPSAFPSANGYAGSGALAEPLREVARHSPGSQNGRSANPETAFLKEKNNNGDGSGRRSSDARSDIACVLLEDGKQGLTKSPVTHAELASLFQWLNDSCGVSARDRCLLLPSPGSPCEQIYNALGMLIAGASIEIADAASIRTASLIERLTDERITLWNLPTALMQNLLANLPAPRAGRQNLKGPRNILLNGEKQCAILADRLKQSFPDARITGLYSHPAAGIWSTVFPFEDNAAAEESGCAVIAQSIPGFEHLVLNKNGEPAPPHVKGELHLRRLLPAPPSESAENLTAQQIVNTALRAERLEDNRISWLRGEEHCFVKYGCCVELTGVEAVLGQHEHILAAEVIAIKANRDADSRVVAFILVDDKSESVSAENVRDFLVLHDRVDLIPDRVVLMNEFPLTPEGEIDRETLISRFASSSHELKGAARSVELEEIHRRLKVIWLDILQLDEVDDDESFFARGGNSLMATLLIARIGDEFSVELSVQNFFRKPTLRAVAELIEAESKTAKDRQKAADFKAVSREKYRVQLPAAGSSSGSGTES